MANFPLSLSLETSLNIGWQSIADTGIYDMVVAERGAHCKNWCFERQSPQSTWPSGPIATRSSGGAAAQALRALRALT